MHNKIVSKTLFIFLRDRLFNKKIKTLIIKLISFIFNNLSYFKKIKIEFL